MTLLVASLFTNGLISFELFSLSVTSWDIAIIVLGVNAALLLAINDRSLMRLDLPVVVLATAFGTWVLIGAFRSPQELRGLTMAALLLRDYVMIYSLLVVLTYALPINTLNRTVFIVGVLMAILAIGLYLPNADIVDTRRPFGSIIILIDEFQVPRLTGLMNDPNFFALSALISLFFVFAFRLNWKNSWVWFGVATIMLSMIFAFSRAGYAALIAGIAITLMIAIVQREYSQRRGVVISLWILALISLITFTSISQLELNKGRSVAELTTLRFDRIANSPRLALWRELLDISEPTDQLVQRDAPPIVGTPDVPIDEIPSDAPPIVDTPDVPIDETPSDAPPTVDVPDLPIDETPSDSTDSSEGRSSSPDSFWNIVLGNGLRSNEVRLGSYSHSSYLDVSEEMGIVGTVLWGAIALAVGISLFRTAMSNSAAIPWISAYAVILVMMSSLSMLFMPFFWIVVAVAIHLSRQKTIEKQKLAVRDQAPLSSLAPTES